MNAATAPEHEPGTANRRPGSEGSELWDLDQDPGKTVQRQLDRDDPVTVYDPEFRATATALGDEYVEEYIDEVSSHVARHEVAAFKYHDMKRYRDCAASFGEQFKYLFPVDEEAASEAGAFYATALLEQDVIEDGIDEVMESRDVRSLVTNVWSQYDDAEPAGIQGIRDYEEQMGEERSLEDILAHPIWEHVEESFSLMAESLDLEHPDVYAEAMTEFFRTHTAIQEADYVGEDAEHDPDELRDRMEQYIEVAQREFLRALPIDFALIPELIPDYKAAVKTHDRHAFPATQADPGDQAAWLYRLLRRDGAVEELAAEIEVLYDRADEEREQELDARREWLRTFAEDGQEVVTLSSDIPHPDVSDERREDAAARVEWWYQVAEQKYRLDEWQENDDRMSGYYRDILSSILEEGELA